MTIFTVVHAIQNLACVPVDQFSSFRDPRCDLSFLDVIKNAIILTVDDFDSSIHINKIVVQETAQTDAKSNVIAVIFSLHLIDSRSLKKIFRLMLAQNFNFLVWSNVIHQMRALEDGKLPSATKNKWTDSMETHALLPGLWEQTVNFGAKESHTSPSFSGLKE